MWRVPVLGLFLAALASAQAHGQATQKASVPAKQVQTEQVGLALRRLDDAYEITFGNVPRRAVLGRLLTEAGVSVEWRDETVADEIVSGSQRGSLDEITAALLADQSFIASYVAIDSVPRMSHLTVLGPAAPGAAPAAAAGPAVAGPEAGTINNPHAGQASDACVAQASPRRLAPEPFISASVSSGGTGKTLRARGQVMLDVGRILIAGGWDDCRGTASNASEIVDVATGKSTPTGTMLTPRAEFSMQVLPSGDVLAIGGTTANALTGSTDRIERFEVASGRWKDAGTLAMRKAGSATCALRDGTMLIVGGKSGGGADLSRRAERYDPRSGKGRVLAAPTAYAHETAPKTLLLADGRCLITSVGRGANLELFDPVSDAFAAVPVPPDVAGTLESVTQLGLLPDGSVLIVAARSFVFSPKGGRFRGVP
jgi:hypothetical protein